MAKPATPPRIKATTAPPMPARADSVSRPDQARTTSSRWKIGAGIFVLLSATGFMMLSMEFTLSFYLRVIPEASLSGHTLSWTVSVITVFLGYPFSRLGTAGAVVYMLLTNILPGYVVIKGWQAVTEGFRGTTVDSAPKSSKGILKWMLGTAGVLGGFMFLLGLKLGEADPSVRLPMAFAGLFVGAMVGLLIGVALGTLAQLVSKAMSKKSS